MFKGEGAPELPAGLNMLHESHLGRVFTIIFRGNTQQITERLAALDPVYMEAVPLTLEEIFIYELGGADYAVRDIVPSAQSAGTRLWAAPCSAALNEDMQIESQTTSATMPSSPHSGNSKDSSLKSLTP